jgi:hypothetical protein
VIRTTRHTPEKIEQTEHLDQHADGWVLEEDEKIHTKEAGGSA